MAESARGVLGKRVGRDGTQGPHPLGNFSINHLTTVKVSADRVDLHYVLDQAEIPTVEERGLSRGDVLARKRAEVARRLELRVDGSRVPLSLERGGRLSFPPGQGGSGSARLAYSFVSPADVRTGVTRLAGLLRESRSAPVAV